MKGKVMMTVWKNFIAVMIPSVFFIILIFLVPEQVTLRNIPVLLNQAILPSILALGLVCNLSVGNWDFAIGAEVLFTAILAGHLAEDIGLGLIGMILFCIIIGTALGTINGALYVFLKVPTLITSIGFMLLLESLSSLIYGGVGYRAKTSLIVLGFYPQNFIIFFVMVAIIFCIYNYRPFGARVRAVGRNPAIASLNGINIVKVKFLCMLLAGLFAGFYAFMSIGISGTFKVQNDMGTIITAFDGIMCVFIAMSLSSLTNVIFGAFLGALLLQITKLGLVVMHIPTELSQIVVAIFVLVFMAYSETQADIIKKLKLKRTDKTYAK